jgi:hypothetical protein
MELKEAAGGVIGSTVFPAGLLDGQGRATYYVSAMTPLGDEFYTEMVVPPGRKPVRAKVEPPKPKTPVDSEVDAELDPAPEPVPPAATAPVSPPLPEPVPADPPSEDPLPGEDPPTP